MPHSTGSTRSPRNAGGPPRSGACWRRRRRRPRPTGPRWGRPLPRRRRGAPARRRRSGECGQDCLLSERGGVLACNRCVRKWLPWAGQTNMPTKAALWVGGGLNCALSKRGRPPYSFVYIAMMTARYYWIVTLFPPFSRRSLPKGKHPGGHKADSPHKVCKDACSCDLDVHTYFPEIPR